MNGDSSENHLGLVCELWKDANDHSCRISCYLYEQHGPSGRILKKIKDSQIEF